MGKSANPCSSRAQSSVLLVGGCQGTCLLLDADDAEGRTARSHFRLANCLVLALCLAIVALLVAFVWS